AHRLEAVANECHDLSKLLARLAGPVDEEDGRGAVSPEAPPDSAPEPSGGTAAELGSKERSNVSDAPIDDSGPASEGLHLLVRQMHAVGRTAESIAWVLQRDFDIEDADETVAAILGADPSASRTGPDERGADEGAGRASRRR
ncbi:MAG TPA: hypothetical protein VKA36_02720, partial [Solirubrobacterales bacterium]|nr:hypothetical protein [Solirubrobacterales bacterium]